MPAQATAERGAATAALPSMLNVPEVAIYLGTTERHIRDLIHRRAIPFTKVGRLVRFSLSDIDAWVAEHTNRPDAA
jgi:excisionase family DNA binding protein